MSKPPKGFEAVMIDEDTLVFSFDVPSPGAPSELSRLSVTEQLVVRLAAEGLTNAAIARRRKCATRTVANHLASAYRKLGISGRIELYRLLGKAPR